MEEITDKYEELMNKYPILFRQKTASEMETCMCWGIEAGYGWYEPLNKLCSYLEELNNIYYNKYKIRIQADQVKSKFGGLRFYYSIVDDDYYYSTESIPNDHKFIGDMLNNITNTLIKQAEDECWNVCEWCGTDGGNNGENLITTSGWVSRICKKCGKAQYEKQTKHYDEINNEKYIPRITWFNDAYYFLNPYHNCGFKFNNNYYSSIIEAFYSEKDKKHLKIYNNIVRLNKDNTAHIIEDLAHEFGFDYIDNDEDYKLMKNIIKAKFKYNYNKPLLVEFLQTKKYKLSNSGRHHNNILGYCVCDDCKDKEHKDLYAKMLMEVREELILENQVIHNSGDIVWKDGEYYLVNDNTGKDQYKKLLFNQVIAKLNKENKNIEDIKVIF